MVIRSFFSPFTESQLIVELMTQIFKLSIYIKNFYFGKFSLLLFVTYKKWFKNIIFIEDFLYMGVLILLSTYSFSCSCESVDLCSLNDERFDERFGEPVTFNLVKLTQLPRRPPRLPFSASEDSPGADNLLTVSKWL